ncbi:MAG: hypothetical protein LUC87_09330, partial [Clostridiales bacterium]|nr:hypothetical protein [Clostridiales bacterium]
PSSEAPPPPAAGPTPHAEAPFGHITNLVHYFAQISQKKSLQIPVDWDKIKKRYPYYFAEKRIRKQFIPAG